MAGYEPLSIDLRLLESFVVLAEELHFTRAAERLHIAQPALSQQIGRLERQLGAKLLTRPPLPVRLTPAGTELHARAGAALADIKAAVSAARAVADGTAGALAIAHLSSYAPDVIPAIAGAFTTAHPEMTLHLSERSIEEQIDGIRAHDVDVAMFHLHPGPDLSSRARNTPAWQTLGRDPYLVESSLPGVFAVGDVRSGSVKRVASAAGEGSIAIRFASEHLGHRGGLAAR